MPFARNPFFLGHEDLLARIASQSQAISGLGGIGKTQLAIEYAYRFRQEYRMVFWVRADTVEYLTASYLAIATLLNLPEKAASEQAITVRAWLGNYQQWLLILDNADDPDLLLTPDEADPLRQRSLFLPAQPGGHVLITTRASSLRHIGIAQPIIVDSFPAEQGALFLLRRAGRLAPEATLETASQQDQALALQIAQALGGLPLALDQAGAYLEATGTSLASYLQTYQLHCAELLQERRGRGLEHPEPVATTWSLALQRVEERNAAAVDLLCFCAFLAPDAIGEEIIDAEAKLPDSILAPIATDSYLLDQASATLRAYSLIERDPAASTITMHRLVQQVTRAALSTEKQHAWMQRVTLAMSEAFPSVEVETWPICERLLPHALHCAQWIELVPIVSPEAASLLNRAAFYLDEHARYELAHPLYQLALAIREQVLGPLHPATATSLNNLASLYRAQGQYELAQPLYQLALAICEQVLGDEHPNTRIVRANYLALLRKKDGEVEG